MFWHIKDMGATKRAQCFRANEKWSWATHMQPPLLTRMVSLIYVVCIYNTCTCEEAVQVSTGAALTVNRWSPIFHQQKQLGPQRLWGLSYFATVQPALTYFVSRSLCDALNYLLHELRLQHLHDLRLQPCWHESLEGIDLIWESLHRPTIILTSGSSVVRVVQPQCPEVVFCRTPITVVRLGDLKCQAHHFLFMFFFVTVDEHHCTGIEHHSQSLQNRCTVDGPCTCPLLWSRVQWLDKGAMDGQCIFWESSSNEMTFLASHIGSTMYSGIQPL